jgi:hypothetical protein
VSKKRRGRGSRPRGSTGGTGSSRSGTSIRAKGGATAKPGGSSGDPASSSGTPAGVRRTSVGSNRTVSRTRGRGGDAGARGGRGSGRTTGRAPVTVSAVQPPLLPSLARGLFAAGGSPPLLVVTFLSVLAIWAVYASTGIIRIAFPGVMAQIMSIAPIHSALDANFFGAGTRVFSPVNVISLALFLLLLRAAVGAFSIALILERFEGHARGREAVRSAARRAIRSLQRFVALEALFMVLMLFLPTVLGPLLGALSLVITFIAPTYFLLYAPIVAVREQSSLRDILRLSVRMARIRGPQHVLLVFAYVMVTLTLVFSTSGGRDTPITPSVMVWSYTLFTNFIHLAVLAALAHRWLSRREDVLAAAAAPREAGSARPRRLFGLR